MTHSRRRKGLARAGELCYGPALMTELDDFVKRHDFVKRLGAEPAAADPVQRGLDSIAYALALLAVEVRTLGTPVQRPSKQKPRKK